VCGLDAAFRPLLVFQPYLLIVVASVEDGGGSAGRRLRSVGSWTGIGRTGTMPR